jgi:hypothetical protein
MMLDRPKTPGKERTPAGVPSGLLDLTRCDSLALGRLNRAFREGIPAASVVGAGSARCGRVISDFLGKLDERTSVARLSVSCADETDFMIQLVRAIGFDTEDFGAEDLKKIFSMFLSYQRSHGARTVICIEDTRDCSGCVTDRLCRYVRLESRERYGLFVVFAEPTGSTDGLATTLAGVVGRGGVQEIRVAPLSLAETREFVQRQTISAGVDDISRVFEFEAITRIHEICAGNPDLIYELCGKCLELAGNESRGAVSMRDVDALAAALGLTASELPGIDLAAFSPDVSRSITLSVQVQGRKAQAHTVDEDCVSVGRDPGNRVCVPSSQVSRRHAMIVRGPQGLKIVDLGSTNGTFVNGARIVSRPLEAGDTVMLGNCTIEIEMASPASDDFSHADQPESNGRGRGQQGHPAAASGYDGVDSVHAAESIRGHAILAAGRGDRATLHERAAQAPSLRKGS